MPQTRKILKVSKSKATLEGAGVHLRRAFGFGEPRTYDPFLLLDDFRNYDPADYAPGFPWHPHRGIETITYVLSGSVEHGDSMGNRGVISAGDVQWMTAGSGIIHQEMPKGESDGRMEGFQLWANLPRSHKMMEPRYQEIKSGQIPTVNLDGGASARVICGEMGGVRGPVENIVIAPLYLDVVVPPKTRINLPTASGFTALAYVYGGRATFCDQQDPFAYPREGSNYFDTGHEAWHDDGSLLVFDDGDEISVTSENESLHFLFISGRPIREPVAWYGPIVMNSEKELRQAFDELEQGTFIKK
ncbi:MAG: pirin family protein [Anaerolineae bacterium]|nr:pirin family protein [Anaerolineae bacterium]